MPRKLIRVESEYKQLVGTKIPSGWLNVFVGRNNSGKSQVLKFLMDNPSRIQVSDIQIDYVGPDRFGVNNDVTVSAGSHTQLLSSPSQRRTDDVNRAERPPIDTSHELVLKLKDKDKDRLLGWHKKYFGNLEIKKIDEENRDSPRKIEADGQPLSVQGTGSRAVLAILVKLFDPSLKALCIDEPELSIEPKTQKKLFEIIKKISQSSTDGLPRKRIFIATHSHLFIDKENSKNNYKVSKKINKVQINRVKSNEELADLIFNLLGNSPSDILLPSNFLIVSGISDKIFLDSVLNIINSSNKRIAVHYAEGDSKIPDAVKTVEQTLKLLNYSPYKKQVCVLLDKQTTEEIKIGDIRKTLADDKEERVIELDQDAIEYYYPKTILKKVCGQKISDSDIKNFLKTLDSNGKQVDFGSASAKLGKFIGGKKMLAEKVSNLLSRSHLSELDEKIIQIVKKTIDLALE